MQRHSFALLFILALAGLTTLSGCWFSPSTYTYTTYDPVYLPLAELREGVNTEAARPLTNPGRIWVYNDYLLINESNEGIHIVDNTMPEAPQFVSFITIPGNSNMSVRDGIMYADSYIDLVAIDISNPSAAREVGRVENIFPQTLEDFGQSVDPERGVIVDWTEREVTVEEGDDVIALNSSSRSGGIDLGGPVANDAAEVAPGGNGNDSRGGSMARFTIVGEVLYIVNHSELQLLTLSQAEQPAIWANVNIGWGIETIFPYGDNLFIGSQTGMFIFDNSNPLNPTQISEFLHVRSCDPVVADENYAYVTLRQGTLCRGGSNQLDIIDIRDIRNPKLVKSYAMQNPHGLAIVGNTLYICDGEAGLKVFNAADREQIELESHDSSLNTYDIIPVGSRAIVIGPDGLHQYDCTDPSNIRKLSVIATR